MTYRQPKTGMRSVDTSTTLLFTKSLNLSLHNLQYKIFTSSVSGSKINIYLRFRAGGRGKRCKLFFRHNLWPEIQRISTCFSHFTKIFFLEDFFHRNRFAISVNSIVWLARRDDFRFKNVSFYVGMTASSPNESQMVSPVAAGHFILIMSSLNVIKA